MVCFMPRPFYLRGKNHDSHGIGGWVDPSASLEAVARRRHPISCRESNSSRSACSPVTVPNERLRPPPHPTIPCVSKVSPRFISGKTTICVVTKCEGLFHKICFLQARSYNSERRKCFCTQKLL